MSTEKLIELSKPVAQAYYDAHDSSTMLIDWLSDSEPEVPAALYSQEYVSALLAELERYKQYAKERDAENESLALTVGRLRVELEAKDKRIAELEQILDGVTPVMIAGGWTAKGISDYAKSLESKLATPVRLPGSFYPDGDIDLPLVVELDEAVEAIRTAGFTVEGNE